MREPAHPYTRGLLHSFPSLHGPRRELVGIPGTPPDLRDTLPGCPFIPRCSFTIPACSEVDMSLAPPSAPGCAGGQARADHRRQPPHGLPDRDPRRSESGRGAVMTEPTGNVPAVGGLAPGAPAA